MATDIFRSYEEVNIDLLRILIKPTRTIKEIQKKAAQKNEQLRIYSSVSRVNLIETEIQTQPPEFVNEYIK
jgi:hypothetical protein